MNDPTTPATRELSADYEHLKDAELSRLSQFSTASSFVTWVRPGTPDDVVDRRNKLAASGGIGAVGLGSIGSIGSGIAATTVTGLITPSESAQVIALCAATAVAAVGAIAHIFRCGIQRRALEAAHPRAIIRVPGAAALAYRSFIASADQLEAANIPDSVRESLAETRQLMDELLEATGDSDHTRSVADASSSRLLEQLRRHAAETHALAGINAERERLISGHNVDLLLERAANTTLDGCAATLAVETHLIASLLAPPAQQQATHALTVSRASHNAPAFPNQPDTDGTSGTDIVAAALSSAP